MNEERPTMDDLVYSIARDLNRLANLAERLERRHRLHPIDKPLESIAASLTGLWWRFPWPEKDDVPKEVVP